MDSSSISKASGVDVAKAQVVVYKDVTCTAALLDGAGTIEVAPAKIGIQYKIRDIIMHGGGTSFAAGGNRLLDLTDGTTVYTQIANADLEAAVSASLPWGNAKVPMLTSTSNTKTVENQALRFKYSGGTTDHSGTGSIAFTVGYTEHTV